MCKSSTRKVKKYLSVLIIVTIVLTLFITTSVNHTYAASPAYGQLKVVGSQLCGQNGQAVQLKGMSSHGLQWYGGFMNSGSIKTTKDWGATVVRAAMYTAENGYIANPASMKAKVKEVVQTAIDLGMYVIIDWHILSDGNPMTYVNQSKEFFKEMSSLYANYPNVIYEICNEPNGSATWAGQIKPYAQQVIPVIRANDPDGIVIVGTGTWSQDIHAAADSPLSYSNIMYACHFYAGTHGQFLRDRINYAMNKGAAIFVTEWGTSDASGNGGPYLTQAKEWVDFMAGKKVSWCNWSLCDKNETSAALLPGASMTGGWTDSNLSASGKFVKANMGGTTINPSPVVSPIRPTATTSPVRPTATPTPVRPTLPPPSPVSGGNCSVSYVIQNSWGTGATVNLTITNNGTTAINGWTLKFAFPGNQVINNLWNASFTQSGANVTIKNTAFNASIPAKGTVQIGFNISYSGTNNKPTAFTLNDKPCVVQ